MNLPGYPDGSTHWRRLQFWKREYHFRSLWELLLRLLSKNKRLALETISIDGSLIQSFAFKEKTGYSGKHNRTGVKISTIADSTGIPIAMVTAKGNIVDISLAQNTVEGIRITHSKVRGATLHGDKGYDSKKFRKLCIDTEIMPHIPKRKTTKVKKKHTLYYLYNSLQGKKRYVIERTNAWIKSFRRLRMRFDYKASSFEAFLYLAIIVICVRRLIT